MHLRRLGGLSVRDLILDTRRAAMGQTEPQPRRDIGIDWQAQGLQRACRSKILGACDLERPKVDVRRHSKSAANLSVAFPEADVEKRAAMQFQPFTQGGLSVWWRDGRK